MLALLPIPMGMGSGPMPGVRKPSKAAPGTSVTGSMGWTGHNIAAAPSNAPGCPGMKGGRQHSHGEWMRLERGSIRPGEGRRGSVSAFMRLLTSFCSCAQTNFFQGVMRTGVMQILLWNSVLCHFATASISCGQNQMVNTF